MGLERLDGAGQVGIAVRAPQEVELGRQIVSFLMDRVAANNRFIRIARAQSGALPLERAFLPATFRNIATTVSSSTCVKFR